MIESTMFIACWSDFLHLAFFNLPLWAIVETVCARFVGSEPIGGSGREIIAVEAN